MKKRILNLLLCLGLTFSFLFVLMPKTEVKGAYSDWNVQIVSGGADVYTSGGEFVTRISFSCDAEPVIPANRDYRQNVLDVYPSWKAQYCVTCDPFADSGNVQGTVGGLTYYELTRSGMQLFCLNSGKSYHAYRCGNNWWETTFTPASLGWSTDQFVMIAKILTVGGNYKDVQNSIWATLGQKTDDGGDWNDLRGTASRLTNSQHRIHDVNITGTPISKLNQEFIMTDTNRKLHLDKFSIGNVTSGMTVVKDGDTTRNVITQPYPLTKTVKINGSATDTHGAESATIMGWDSNVAQEFAYLGSFAGSIQTDAYPDAEYSVTMPTGSIFFQKKDSFGQNVTRNYCPVTHLCVRDDADATANTFRLLIDDTSDWWNTNADTGTAVTVNGKTYHVFKLEDGTTSFRTNDNGQFTISNVLLGKYYLQETSVDENVFVLNEELIEITVNQNTTSNAEMKNINLFGDMELQKYDEFTNSGILNTYTNDASGNQFRLKYVDTLGNPNLFLGKTFNLPDGTVSVNPNDRYLYIDGSPIFTTNNRGYIHICEAFNATRNLCIPFGNWQLEEVAVQNEYELNTEIVDVEINVGEKTPVDFTNDYREVKLKLYKQDRYNEEMVQGAKYVLYDIDRYNIGDASKGKGNLYEGQEKQIFNTIGEREIKNFYDNYVGQQDGKFPDYNYVYEFVVDGKQPIDKYISLEENAEMLTGVSSGKTIVKVSQQVLDLYGTIQDRYYYIGDHTFDPYEDFNFFLDEAGELPINVRSKEYTITKVSSVESEEVVSATTSIAKAVVESMNEGEEEVTNAFLDKLEELGLTTTEDGDNLIIELSTDDYVAQLEELNSVLEGIIETPLTAETETETIETQEETPIASLNDMWDVEGKYVITYTIVDEARHKWTFTRNVSYTDDHVHICDFNAVLNQYVWGDTKEICKEIEDENPEVKRAPEEYNYETRTITYDPSIIIQKVEGEEEATYVDEFIMWCLDRESKPDLNLMEDVDHIYKIGEYTTDSNGEAMIEGLMHSRTYLVCEDELPQHYTYDEMENVCFVIMSNYAEGVVQKVNTKNNELTEPIIRTTANFEDGSKLMQVTSQGADVTIVDNVKYMGFKDLIGQSVTFKGWVVSKTTGEKVSEEVSQTLDVETAKGNVEISFKFHVENITQDYVVFEEVYNAEGELISYHKDLEDTDQTVSIEGIPEIKTTLTGEQGEKKVKNFEEITLIDTVEYTNFVVDREYTIEGELVRKSDETVIATATTTFTPSTPNGVVELTFVFDGSELAGSQVVAFETAMYEGEIYARHRDINDPGQTVEIERKELLVGTVASTHDVHISENNTMVKLTDEVKYENLDSDKVYMMRGYLVDKKTGEPIILNHKMIEGYKVFMTASVSGSVDVPFEFDAAIDENNWLDDGEYVIYEELYEVTLIKQDGELSKDNVKDKELICEHKELDNLDETFKFTDDYRTYRFKKKKEVKYREYYIPATGIGEVSQTSAEPALMALAVFSCLPTSIYFVNKSLKKKKEHQ